MHKYTPHAVVGSLGLFTAFHLFFKEFFVSVIQKLADSTVGRVKKLFKRRKKKHTKKK